MKKNLITFILLVLSSRGFAQNILDSIHPLFQGELDGDKIRNHYAQQSTGSTIYGKDSRENQIILNIFHSNNLFTQTGLHKPDLLIEQKEFRNKYHSYPVALFDSIGVIVTADGINHLNAG